MGSIDPRTAQGGLHILIAGAGIGGLATAIALRQQGHRVEVSYSCIRTSGCRQEVETKTWTQLFERSRFANEIGAAIHLTPNANSALLRLGIDGTKFGAVETEQVPAAMLAR